MTYERIRKTIQKKNPISKIVKSKNQGQIAPCEQKKITKEKANFCSNTVFSLL